MENEEIRLQALRVLNEHFKYEGKLGCLEDRQVKLVLDAMIEFCQFGSIRFFCKNCGSKSMIEVEGEYHCEECGNNQK